jgi:hypothetical protein
VEGNARDIGSGVDSGVGIGGVGNERHEYKRWKRERQPAERLQDAPDLSVEHRLQRVGFVGEGQELE